MQRFAKTLVHAALALTLASCGRGDASQATPQDELAVRRGDLHERVVLNGEVARTREEVIAHLTGLVGARVTVTLEIEAQVPSGASDHVVRTVTENSRTLKFTSHGFENE